MKICQRIEFRTAVGTLLREPDLIPPQKVARLERVIMARKDELSALWICFRTLKESDNFACDVWVDIGAEFVDEKQSLFIDCLNDFVRQFE